MTLAVDKLAWARTDRPAVRHIAIIMDGNGRWAAERGLPRAEGHRQGVESVRRTVEAALELGITHLTLFSFSSENWARPKQEINDLFGLLRRFIRRDLADLHKNGVKIRVIGARTGLDADLLRLIDDAVELTKDNTALNLTIAFNYGARDEIARAARRIAEDVAAGSLAAVRGDGGALRRPISIPPISPIPTSSSARAASCVCRTSSCGSSPMPSSCSSTPTGRTSRGRQLEAAIARISAAQPALRRHLGEIHRVTGTGTLPTEERREATGRKPEVVKRVASAIVLAALALGATIASPWTFLVLVMVGSGIVAWEWGRLTRGNGFDGTALVAAVSVAAVAVLVSLGRPELALFMLAAAVVAIGFTAFRLGPRRLVARGADLRRAPGGCARVAPQRSSLRRRRRALSFCRCLDHRHRLLCLRTPDRRPQARAPHLADRRPGAGLSSAPSRLLSWALPSRPPSRALRP